MSQHWAQAANDLRVWLEDRRKNRLDDDWDLQQVLLVALRNRFLSRNIPYGTAHDAAADESVAIINNLDTLRPILEHYWKEHPVDN